jgi:hypothetical protein
MRRTVPTCCRARGGPAPKPGFATLTAAIAAARAPTIRRRKVVTQLSHQAARNMVGPWGMRCDDLCTSAGVGTWSDGWTGAYADWLSAAVVAFVALAVRGQ